MRVEATPYTLIHETSPFVTEGGQASGRLWHLERGVECVVVMGTFDGAHLGHRMLLDGAARDAHDRGLPLVGMTFSPPPDELFGVEGAGHRLLSEDDRIAALFSCGVEGVVAFDFTPEFAELDAEAFSRLALHDVVRARSVHVGKNFRFARGAVSGEAELTACGEGLGFACVAHELAEVDGDVVSSTRVRRLLDKGRVSEAADLLGRCHYVRGEVIHGRGEATAFGFPTANVAVDPRLRLPAEGVYACYVEARGMVWPAAVNVGAPVTFGGGTKNFLEANLIGFVGDLYGEEVCVSFVEWIRAQRRFESIDELEKVVLENISWVSEVLDAPHEVLR